ncbi:hypothetical protein PQ478_09305 [Alkalihalophilus pseudofirmus]|uniref:hypothetical protein n=1 Tax=Alkalihalophilus pseudofirmus TaxID=79885 RepID=UPI00259B37EB|nr:hypothetical protein [Alkalihalophilus pseudofirmus]WEG18666.1 hypothetical protein PQ478_09305 [Alkalihalophilus pseudofirmus]
MKQTVFTKFVEVNQPREKKWYGIISVEKSADKLVTFTSELRGQAERHFKEQAKLLGGKLDKNTVRVMG